MNGNFHYLHTDRFIYISIQGLDVCGHEYISLTIGVVSSRIFSATVSKLLKQYVLPSFVNNLEKQIYIYVLALLPASELECESLSRHPPHPLPYFPPSFPSEILTTKIFSLRTLSSSSPLSFNSPQGGCRRDWLLGAQGEGERERDRVTAEFYLLMDVGE